MKKVYITGGDGGEGWMRRRMEERGEGGGEGGGGGEEGGGWMYPPPTANRGQHTGSSYRRKQDVRVGVVCSIIIRQSSISYTHSTHTHTM